MNRKRTCVDMNFVFILCSLPASWKLQHTSQSFSINIIRKIAFLAATKVEGGGFSWLLSANSSLYVTKEVLW